MRRTLLHHSGLGVYIFTHGTMTSAEGWWSRGLTASERGKGVRRASAFSGRVLMVTVRQCMRQSVHTTRGGGGVCVITSLMH